MIIATNLETAHRYGDIFPSLLRLRHQGFKQRQDYDVPSYNGMEYDTYDNPSAYYLTWRDENNIVRGCSRLIPTQRNYMIEELWPELVDGTLPKQPEVWEASRYCIDKNLPSETRKRINGELLCAFQEFCMARNVSWMIGVMTPPIWKCVFINSGWPIEKLGPALPDGPRQVITAGRMPISRTILGHLRKNFSIPPNILIDPYYDERVSA